MPKLKNQRHIAEIMVSNALLRHPKALEQAEVFFRDKPELRDMWPDWCYFPMAATYAILTDGTDVDRAADVLAQRSGAEELSILTAAIAWGPFKGVYRYDATIAETLKMQPLDGNVPVQALMCMPEPCPFIEAPVSFGERTFDGFFAWLENDVGEGTATGMELRLLFLDKHQEVAAYPIILRGTVDQSVVALVESAERRLPGQIDSKLKPLQEHLRSSISGAINLILYLCSENPDISGDHPWHSRPRDGRKPVKAAIRWDVGVWLGSTIRRYQNERVRYGQVADTQEEREGRAAPRPHIRRAHWHHFWTGPMEGNRALTLRWLPPIPVGANTDDEIKVVVRPVE